MCPGASMTTCSKPSAKGDPGRHQRPGRGRPHRRHPPRRRRRPLLRETDDRLLVAPTVLAETYGLLHKIGGPAPEVAFLRSIAAGELELAVLTVADVARMAELAKRYADLGLGGTDASLVALAERLDLTTLAPPLQ